MHGNKSRMEVHESFDCTVRDFLKILPWIQTCPVAVEIPDVGQPPDHVQPKTQLRSLSCSFLCKKAAAPSLSRPTVGTFSRDAQAGHALPQGIQTSSFMGNFGGVEGSGLQVKIQSKPHVKIPLCHLRPRKDFCAATNCFGRISCSGAESFCISGI